MAGNDVSREVLCCFCGVWLNEADALEVQVSYEEEVQGLYAHKHCLAERLYPAIPLHPSLLPD